MSEDILPGEDWIAYIRRMHRRDQMREFPDWYKQMHYSEKNKIVAQVRHDVWKLYPESFFLWTFSKEGWKIGYAIYNWQNMGLSERGNLRRTSNPQMIGEYHRHTDVVHAGNDITFSGEADCKLWAWSCVWLNGFRTGIPAEVYARGLTEEEFAWQLQQVYGVHEPKTNSTKGTIQ